MLTVQQVSKKLGITPQAVYKKINNQLSTELKPFIKDEKRGSRTVKMITSEGVEIIKNSIPQPVDKQVKQQLNNDEQQLIDLLEETIATLNEQLRKKDEQISVKDEQINRLGDMIETNQELNKNNQILLGRQQNIRALVEEEVENIQPKVKKGKWDKFKDIFKN